MTFVLIKYLTLLCQYKTNWPTIMIYLFIIQVLLFCFLIANVAKLFTNLLIDKQ